MLGNRNITNLTNKNMNHYFQIHTFIKYKTGVLVRKMAFMMHFSWVSFKI